MCVIKYPKTSTRILLAEWVTSLPSFSMWIEGLIIWYIFDQVPYQTFTHLDSPIRKWYSEAFLWIQRNVTSPASHSAHKEQQILSSAEALLYLSFFQQLQWQSNRRHSKYGTFRGKDQAPTTLIESLLPVPHPPHRSHEFPLPVSSGYAGHQMSQPSKRAEPSSARDYIHLFPLHLTISVDHHNVHLKTTASLSIFNLPCTFSAPKEIPTLASKAI